MSMASDYRECQGIYDEQVLKLYRSIRDSLRSNGSIYVVDDYLSSIAGIERIPTKYDSETACFVVRGNDPNHSVTFLLRASGAFRPTLRLDRMSGGLGDNSYLNLAAGNLLSACLAMENLQRKKQNKLPIDVYMVLIGMRDGNLGYQRFDSQSLRDSVLGTIGRSTHLVVVESTGLRACIVQKGCIVLRLEISGRSHQPAFPWLGENPWDVLIKFEENVSNTMKPKHDIYPVEVGKAPPMMLSNFLIGYPTMTPVWLKYQQPYMFGERNSIEVEYYICIPPESSIKEMEDRLQGTAKETAKRVGCGVEVSMTYEEEPFREDAKSAIVRATCNAFKKLTRFEPVFEWLPYPVSANNLTSSGFAKDIMVLGPGDWTFSSTQDDKTIIAEALHASEIFAEIPFEGALSEDKL